MVSVRKVPALRDAAVRVAARMSKMIFFIYKITISTSKITKLYDNYVCIAKEKSITLRSMKTKRFLFLVAFLTSSLLTLSAQNDKPALDHSVYDSWKGFADLQIPYDGNILYYTVREEQGDSFLTYRDLRTDKEIKIERGTHITVDKEGKFALVRISPAYKLTRQEKIDKTPAAKKLQDSLAIVNFSTGVVTKLPNAKSPKYGDNLGRYFAYKMIKDPEEIKEAEEKAAKEAEAKAAQEAEAASGTAAKAAEGTATEATVAEALASKDTTAKAEAKKPAKKKSTNLRFDKDVSVRHSRQCRGRIFRQQIHKTCVYLLFGCKRQERYPQGHLFLLSQDGKG